ncbi:MAG: response regulator transcription factor [Anaerolineales bacterium]|nr:response regulator transcription factor [Anaerolineales bacterium]
MRERWSDRVVVVGLVSSLEQARDAIEQLRPDLAIVDYDDQGLDREEFLTYFWSGKHPLRVVLLSLKDGQEGSQAVVYDRRTMVAARIEDWLERDTVWDPNSQETESDRGDNV